MSLRGRHFVLLWLLVFLAVATTVVTRQSRALAAARHVRELREERLALEAQRADLERRIRTSSGRESLVGVAERLGLHQPADSEFVILPVPSVGDTSAGGERR